MGGPGRDADGPVIRAAGGVGATSPTGAAGAGQVTGVGQANDVGQETGVGQANGTTGTDRSADVDALRRVDWRFLLDAPDLGRVAVDEAADPALRAGLAAAGADIVRFEASAIEPAARPFDVAVLVAPSALRIEDVARRTAPGAWVIAELAPPWRRLRAGRRGRQAVGPRAAAQVLRRQGFDVELRWHWPSFESALELVPLDDRTALDHSLHRRRSRRARFAAAAIRIAARLGWLASLLPAVAVTAHRPSGDGSIRPGFLQAVVAAGGGPAAVAGSIPAHRSLVLTPRFPASRHVLALAFDERGRLGLVAKAPRRREDDSGLRREAAALGRVSSGSPDGVAHRTPARAIAPRSLGVTEVRGWPVLLETAVAGSPLGRPAVRADRERWVGAARDLADRLAAAGEPATPDDRLERLMETPLARLAAALPAGDPLAARIPRTIAKLRPLAAAHLTTVLEHGDLAPPNLLVTEGGELAALDWELAEPCGLPGHDLALFLLFTAIAVAGPGTERDPAASGEAAAVAFTGPDPWAILALRRHLEAVGTDPELALPLAVAAFARVAASMPERAGRDPGSWLATDRHVVAWTRLLERLP